MTHKMTFLCTHNHETTTKISVNEHAFNALFDCVVHSRNRKLVFNTTYTGNEHSRKITPLYKH